MPLTARMPDLAALQVFVAVALTGSLNAAARELGVSQQAVSARITSIEKQTGVVLVSRTPQGSTLTPAGVSVAEWADRLLKSAAELDAGLAALRHDRRTRLRVSASLTVAEQLLPRWLVSLQIAGRDRGTEPAEITLTATNSDRVIDDIRSGRADLGFIEGPRVPKGLRSRIVARDQLVLIVRPDHPWTRRRRAVSAAELNDTALISREEGSGTRDALSARPAVGVGPEAGSGATDDVLVHHIGSPGRGPGRCRAGGAQ